MSLRKILIDKLTDEIISEDSYIGRGNANELAEYKLDEILDKIVQIPNLERKIEHLELELEESSNKHSELESRVKDLEYRIQAIDSLKDEVYEMIRGEE